MRPPAGVEVVRLPDWLLTERRGKFSGRCPCGYMLLDSGDLDLLNDLMAMHIEDKHPNGDET